MQNKRIGTAKIIAIGVRYINYVWKNKINEK